MPSASDVTDWNGQCANLQLVWEPVMFTEENTPELGLYDFRFRMYIRARPFLQSDP